MVKTIFAGMKGDLICIQAVSISFHRAWACSVQLCQPLKVRILPISLWFLLPHPTPHRVFSFPFALYSVSPIQHGERSGVGMLKEQMWRKKKTVVCLSLESKIKNVYSPTFWLRWPPSICFAHYQSNCIVILFFLDYPQVQCKYIRVLVISKGPHETYD